MLKGQVLVTSHIVIAPDGKTRTSTQTGKNAQGQTVNNVVFYEKQEQHGKSAARAAPCGADRTNKVSLRITLFTRPCA
jgi:hypothetical protein